MQADNTQVTLPPCATCGLPDEPDEQGRECLCIVRASGALLGGTHQQAVNEYDARQVTLRAPHATATKHAAKTHCPHGHEYSPENTWMMPQAWNRERFARVCRTCYPGRRNLRTLAQHMADQELAA